MKKIVVAALSAALCVCATGQNVTNVEETGATYIGATRLVDKFDGETVAMSYFAEYGLTIGTYDDNPSVVETAVVVKTFSTLGRWVDINPGSKLILKVNGENMVLTTPKGTLYVGAHDSFVGTKGWLGAVSGTKAVFHAATATYPISGEDLEKLLQYGFSKFRFQVVGDVCEGEFSDRKTRRMAENLKDAHDEIVEEQAEIASKVNDLSDF